MTTAFSRGCQGYLHYSKWNATFYLSRK